MEHTPALDLELKERVTGREVNLVGHARVPARDDQSSWVGVAFDLRDEARDLVNAVARRIVAAERTPEIAVDGAAVALLAPVAARAREVGPLLPDVHAARAQGSLVRVARQKPEQLFGDPAEGGALGRHDGKARAQTKARLIAEVRDRADAGAVGVMRAVFEHGFEQVLTLFHEKESRRFSGAGSREIFPGQPRRASCRAGKSAPDRRQAV